MATINNLITRNKAFFLFMIGMILVRSAIADWYSVPSGSMYPSLLIGDRIIADRVAYDLKLPFTDIVLTHIADPKRGDIVTFSSPEDGARLVKRLVGLPGDTVEMRNEIFYLNGVPASYVTATGGVASRVTPGYDGKQIVLNERILGSQRPIVLMPERPDALRNFGPMQVPQGEYLMLGDSRDNSRDSRFIGFVKRELITGRVGRVAFSLDAERYFTPRLERFGASLDDDNS
ncbi:signal peptidase I [Actimicrobium antarcticum]|uniref:Signal peptidase I n=1 Tax=Actimicrobium antarcticum TaxID=1051899 RepID=A0ABP7TFL3_9BURK